MYTYEKLGFLNKKMNIIPGGSKTILKEKIYNKDNKVWIMPVETAIVLKHIENLQMCLIIVMTDQIETLSL